MRITVPASLTEAQYKKYEHSPAQTDYLEFAGRPHLHMVADDWEEIAAAIDSWLGGVLDAPAAGHAEDHGVAASRAPRRVR